MEHNIIQFILMFFKREFPIRDIARGLIRDSHILRKRNPPV